MPGLKKFTKEFYDERYFDGKTSCFTNYDAERLRPEFKTWADKIIGYYQAGSVLEIGCAFGFLVDVLVDNKVDAYGCDISEYAVSKAKNKHRLTVCDVRDGLPYPDNYVDVIFSASTLEHIDIDFIPFLLKEISRVARCGFLIHIPITVNDTNEPWGDPTHVTYMSTSWWITTAFNAGGWLVDLHKSEQIDERGCHSVTLYFYKCSKP
jgi:SAM-dependent methyltransferase